MIGLPAPELPEPIDELIRRSAPLVLHRLVRRHGQFDACEDAVQEASIAAAAQWPTQGVPDDPVAWLATVATRRFIDELRSERARRDREIAVQETSVAPTVTGEDDTLALLFLCCHPALSAPSQIALTLRAVGGLTTAQIAQAFLVPESTMAQRISRAKQRIRDSGGRFVPPPAEERQARLQAVLHTLYLIFNEGYTASGGAELRRPELTAEAIRVTRQLHARLPGDGEIAGLLALLLLTDAHRAARLDDHGMLVPLAQQDRSRWDWPAIEEGTALVSAALATSPVGPYQLQAAIAAVHGEAHRAEDTDWPQIVALYRVLATVAPGPMVTLNRAVAEAMVAGPAAGLALIDELNGDSRMTGNHRVAAVRAHLLELSGDLRAALIAFREAARRTTSLAEQRYLSARAGSVHKQIMEAEAATDLR